MQLLEVFNRILWRTIPSGLARRILRDRYFPLHPGMVADQAAALSENRDCKTVAIQDITIRVPQEWGCSKAVPHAASGGGPPAPGFQVLLYPPPGFYMHWAIYRWPPDSPEQLMNQIRGQAEERGWTLRNMHLRDHSHLKIVDAIAEARNGVTHRFVNFYYKDHEYFCEIKADTPRLFESAAPLFEASLGTIHAA